MEITKYSVKALDSVCLSKRLSDLQIIYTKRQGIQEDIAVLAATFSVRKYERKDVIR